MADAAERKLVLFRHAKSAWPDVPDHERPLAGRGRRDAPVMGRWLRDAGCVPGQVLCSTALRARQTWQLAAQGLRAEPEVTFDRRIYQASADGLLTLVRQARPAARTLLVVGHDPAIRQAALLLAAGGQAEAETPAAGTVRRIHAKFPTAAVAVLEFTGTWPGLAPGGARLAAFVTPRDLASRG